MYIKKNNEIKFIYLCMLLFYFSLICLLWKKIICLINSVYDKKKILLV